MVPAKAKNVRGGLEYLRVMLSKKGAADFTRKVSSLTCVRRQPRRHRPAARPARRSTRLLDAAGSNAFNWIYRSYYRKLERNLVDAACGEFFTGRIDAGRVPRPVPEGAPTRSPGHLDQEVQAGLTRDGAP